MGYDSTAFMRERPEGARRWFVVKSIPRKESVAKQHLQRQNFETYLPLMASSIATQRATGATRLAAFFPGYLFVKLDLSRERWRSINGTIGVSSVLQTGGLPTPVPYGLVEHLQSRTSETGLLGFEDEFAPGAAIRIVGGPFDRLFGEFQALDEEGRARVLLEIMGRPIAVSLPRASIMSVS
ncbi:MAG: transcription termination/antitermination NusG family protein [Hyphomonadaceae bacterium]